MSRAAPGSGRAWVLAAGPPRSRRRSCRCWSAPPCAAASGGCAPGPRWRRCSARFVIQIGTNFANDVFDHEKGADTHERLGPTRAVQAGPAQPRAGAARDGRGLRARDRVRAVPDGGRGLAGRGHRRALDRSPAIAYTGGPYPLGYHGLGDVFVMVFFGFVAVCGTAFVQLGAVPARWRGCASVPVGALATAVLVVNNVRDRADRRAGRQAHARGALRAARRRRRVRRARSRSPTRSRSASPSPAARGPPPARHGAARRSAAARGDRRQRRAGVQPLPGPDRAAAAGARRAVRGRPRGRLTMRIVSIAARTIRWSIGSRGAARGRSERAAVVIEARTDRGVVGLGEAAPLPGLSAETLADVERAIAAFAMRAPFDLADRDTACALAAAATTAPSAQFAIETALLDALARDRRISLAALLRAPAGHARVPLAAVVDDPEDASRAFAAGIRCFKIKLIASDDPARVFAIAEAVPGARLRIDANRSWPRDEVAGRLAQLAASRSTTSRSRASMLAAAVEAAGVQARARRELAGAHRRRAACSPCAAPSSPPSCSSQRCSAACPRSSRLPSSRVALASPRSSRTGSKGRSARLPRRARARARWRSPRRPRRTPCARGLARRGSADRPGPRSCRGIAWPRVRRARPRRCGEGMQRHRWRDRAMMWRTRTRALATRVWAPRSSVHRRITMAGSAISTTDRRSTTRPCNLSRAETQPASLRCALSSPESDCPPWHSKWLCNAGVRTRKRPQPAPLRCALSSPGPAHSPGHSKWLCDAGVRTRERRAPTWARQRLAGGHGETDGRMAAS